MPWKEVPPMNQKMQFVSLAASGRFSVSQLCEDFDISRKTGHKGLGRYATCGSVGLADLSHRPRSCSHQTSESVLAWIILERKAHCDGRPRRRQVLIFD